MSNKSENKNEEIINDNPYDSISRNKSKSDNQSSKSESNKSKVAELNILENLDIQKIKDLNTKCLEFIFEDKSEIALEILKKIEVFLESNLLDSKFNFDKNLIILILHNIACCYQKLKDYGNCITYLDGVIYHFENEIEKKYKIKINEENILQNLYKDTSSYSYLGDLILELRFCAKFHLQMCAVLSQAKKHMKALKHAKLALLICEDNLIKTYYLFVQMESKNINFLDNTDNEKKDKIENSKNNNLENEDKKELLKKIITDLYDKIKKLRKNTGVNDNKTSSNENNRKNKNNFGSYLKYRKNEIHDYQKNLALLNNIRKLFTCDINKEDWLSNLNIGNIVYLSPLNDGDLDLDSEPKYELLGDAILEKVIFISMSCFCIAMEMYQLASDKNNKRINGEYFLKKACDLIDLYLPISCPIIKHFINIYYKYYEKDLDIIPEGKIVDYKINLTRNEIEINKDAQSFIRMQKINYINYNIESIPKINMSNIINRKEIKDISLSHITNNNISKKTKISLGGLKLNLENILNNKNNSSREKGPKNIKLNSFKENKNINVSNAKKNINIENIHINNNFEIYPNKNNLNVAEKSKIKELPKFKLNFTKINNLNKSGEDQKNLSNNTYNTAKNKIKKINMKISVHGKTNRDSSSKNKSKIDKINIKEGFKLERLKLNKKNIYINEALGTSRKEKHNKKNNTKLNINKCNNTNKHISKTSRQKKSPINNNKGIIKGNLFDKIMINKNKKIKQQKDKKIKSNTNKNNFGYLTQREVSNNKLKERIYLNSEIRFKSKNNSLNDKKNKHLNQVNSFNDGHKYQKILNNWNKTKNSITNTNNTVQVNKVEKSKKIKKKNEVKSKIIKKKKINLINKLFNNLFYIEIKQNNTGNINKNSETVFEYNKYIENPININNIAPLIKIKNPFKI